MHRRGFDIHLMKIQSTAVEMFCITKKVFYGAKIVEKCRKNKKAV